MRHKRTRDVDQDLNVAADQILQRRRSSLVRNVHHVDSGRLLEQFSGQMRGGADTRRAEGNLAGIRLGVDDQLLDVLHWQVVVRGHDQRRDADQGYRYEALHGVERQLARIQRRICRVRCDHGEERCSVRRCFCCDIGAED